MLNTVVFVNGSGMSPFDGALAEDCWRRVTEMKLSVPLVLVQTVLLSVLNLLVVVGNGLVISAVVRYKRLRNVSGLLIASLATADLLVGLMVLPFSAINTILGIWIFNAVWCHVWLAFDVWMCTSSIYNLLVIALDRFVAVTRPLNYRSIVTRKRAFLIIACAWLLSFVISFPPMIMTWPEAFSQPSLNCTCTPMSNSPAYIIYSSTGSFHLPFVVIFYLYYRIYLTVRDATSSTSRGYVSVKGQQQQQHQQLESPSHVDVGFISQLNDSVSSLFDNNGSGPNGRKTPSKRVVKNFKSNPTLAAASSEKSSTAHLEGIVLRVHRGKYNPNSQETTAPAMPRASPCPFTSSPFPTAPAQRPPVNRIKSLHFFATANADDYAASPTIRRHKNVSFTNSTIAAAAAAATDSPKLVVKSKLRDQFTLNKKYQRKLEIEIKALKTVGLVTFCFVMCWLGFSIIYTLQAFSLCQYNLECIHPLIFGIFFWLGYANSAVNPLIYAACNRQYRQAFKELLLCRHFQSASSSTMSTKTFERSGSLDQSVMN